MDNNSWELDLHNSMKSMGSTSSYLCSSQIEEWRRDDKLHSPLGHKEEIRQIQGLMGR